MLILRHCSFPVLALLFAPLLIAASVAVPVAAQAQTEDSTQCLSKDECRSLRESLKQAKREIRPLRRERRQLQEQIRETPAGEEREALLAEARELHRQIREMRRERRPEVRRFRAGCRRECFST